MRRLKENRFAARITKDSISSLPLVSFGGDIVLVHNPQGVHEAIEYLNQQTVVGVDTETRPSFQKGIHHPTALLQISTEERCYLFQLLQCGFCSSLAELFANPNICKVGLAFKEDLRGLSSLHAFSAENCIDLQKIVLKYGILDLGLQKIFAIVFGRRISKSQQLTNWENVRLTTDQQRYAATDAWATLLIYKELMMTKPLRRKEYMQLQSEDLLRQQEHQQV